MLVPGREAMFMVRIAGSLGVFLMVCGLAAAQTSGAKPSGTAAAIQQWSGILMDANCSSSESAKPANESGTVDSGRPEKGHKKSAEAQSCPVSSSTAAFALKTSAGQVIKFDAIGNSRAAEELKTKQGWTKNLSSGKPIHAKVSGILNGDVVTVTSIG